MLGKLFMIYNVTKAEFANVIAYIFSNNDELIIYKNYK